MSTFSHLDSVYCIDAHPTSPSVVVTASEDGCVYIVDTREPTNFMCKCMPVHVHCIIMWLFNR